MSYDPDFDSFALEAAVSKDCRGFVAGDVVRMNDFGAFADCVILGFNRKNYARLVRPYIYAASTGTTGPVPLTGVETFDVPVEQISKYYRVMDHGRVTK